MPPKRNVPDDPPDMPISLRLKYGVHTIFLLVDPLAPFSEVTTELLDVLRDRHAEGLRATHDDLPEPLPQEDADSHVSYGVLKDPHDESKGWKDLKIDGSETPIDKGLKNNMMVAFVIRDASEAGEAPHFLVHENKGQRGLSSLYGKTASRELVAYPRHDTQGAHREGGRFAEDMVVEQL
ncbi:hypothetical protein VM1G_06568 [Cytospora mali]|uniref:Uncharacterized protein n=1 Tax=Cytospora mali TaxID=578113 RepID=A0A194W1W7_CYTMA|nr:hypothetical protein VM1G_06568 [Valsa mali]